MNYFNLKYNNKQKECNDEQNEEKMRFISEVIRKKIPPKNHSQCNGIKYTVSPLPLFTFYNIRTSAFIYIELSMCVWACKSFIKKFKFYTCIWIWIWNIVFRFFCFVWFFEAQNALVIGQVNKKRRKIWRGTKLFRRIYRKREYFNWFCVPKNQKVNDM